MPTIAERLQAIYDQVPSAECKGLCTDLCGPIASTEWWDASMARVEWERIAGAVGYEPSLAPGSLVCPMLAKGKCSVYAVRPLICRLFGSVDDPLMICGYGCRPRSGLLSNYRAHRLIDAVKALD